MPARNACATTPVSRVLLRATKYDGAAHWIQSFRVISDDGNLLVAHYNARAPIFTSRGEFRSPYDSRVYFWRDRWFNVFRLSKPGCSLALWYCNITTPPVIEGGEITYIDLDLDVVVRPNGCIDLQDQDDFANHQKKYCYPAEVIAKAEDAAAEVTALAQRHKFPFDQG